MSPPRLLTNSGDRVLIAAAIVLALAASGCAHRLPDAPKAPVRGDESALVNQLVNQVRRFNDDVLRAALAGEISPLREEENLSYARRLDEDAAAIRESLPRGASEAEAIALLNQHFFGPTRLAVSSDLVGPESVSVAAVLDSRRGTCVGLAIVYLALAQRLGLDAHAVATPVHLFIRVPIGDTVRNVELTESGRDIDDDSYRRRYKIDDASVAAGVFMRELSNAEVVAQLLSNQAVVLSKQGRLEDALGRYDAALALAPQLVAAWYNRGLDLMNAGRLQEALASFDHAIELYPSDAQAHNNRGLAKVRLGDREGARADFIRALELEPQMREAGENLRRLREGAPVDSP